MPKGTVSTRPWFAEQRPRVARASLFRLAHEAGDPLFCLCEGGQGHRVFKHDATGRTLPHAAKSSKRAALGPQRMFKPELGAERAAERAKPRWVVSARHMTGRADLSSPPETRSPAACSGARPENVYRISEKSQQELAGALRLIQTRSRCRAVIGLLAAPLCARAGTGRPPVHRSPAA
jgi:hypothetical protein